MAEPDPEAYRLAFEEARRALEDQERAVSELRSRAGSLIAGAAITTSFFGGQALNRDAINATGWIAIGCFVLLGLTVLFIVWPRRDWEFALSPQKFLQTYLEPQDAEPLALHLIHRDLALHIGSSASSNRSKLRHVMIAFRAGAVLLTAEVVAWVAVLIEQT